MLPNVYVSVNFVRLVFENQLYNAQLLDFINRMSLIIVMNCSVIIAI